MLSCSLISQRERDDAYNAGEEISGTGQKYSTNVFVVFIKMQSEQAVVVWKTLSKAPYCQKRGWLVFYDTN